MQCVSDACQPSGSAFSLVSILNWKMCLSRESQLHLQRSFLKVESGLGKGKCSFSGCI